MRKRIVIVAALLLSLACMQAVVARKGDTQEVRAASKRFYEALNAMFSGDLDPMKAVWSHRDDVTYMGPAGGFRVGWKNVLADWEAQAVLKLGGSVKPTDLRMTVGRDLAIVRNLEIGENEDADGKLRRVEIRSTSTFRKENGEWKMIGHHTDLLPFLKK